MTQLWSRVAGEPPGQPEKVLTTGTSSSCARRTLLRKSRSASRATALSGWTGLSWQLNALRIRPREVMACM